jgi:hypothetical protein
MAPEVLVGICVRPYSGACMRLPHVPLFAIVVAALLAGCEEKASKPEPAPAAPSAPAAPVAAAPEASALFLPCKAITAAEIGAIVGYAVTSKEVPGGGCSFDPVDDPRGISVAIADGVAVGTGGGIESSEVGSKAMIDGAAQALPGVGDAAYVVVGKGKVMAKTQQQAQGAVQRKGQFVGVTIAQLSDASAEKVSQAAIDTLKLVAGKI